MSQNPIPFAERIDREYERFKDGDLHDYTHQFTVDGPCRHLCTLDDHVFDCKSSPCRYGYEYTVHCRACIDKTTREAVL